MDGRTEIVLRPLGHMRNRMLGKVANVVAIVHVLSTFTPGILTAVAKRFRDGKSTPPMFPDSELEGPNDRVVRLHLQKQVGERPVLDLEIKLMMLKMVDFPSVEIHGEACQLRKNWPKLANTGLLTEMDILEI